MVADWVPRVDEDTLSGFYAPAFPLGGAQPQRSVYLCPLCEDRKEDSRIASDSGKDDGVSVFEAGGIDSNVPSMVIHFLKNLHPHC